MIGGIIVATRRYGGKAVVAAVESVGGGHERMLAVRLVVGDDVGEGKALVRSAGVATGWWLCTTLAAEPFCSYCSSSQSSFFLLAVFAFINFSISFPFYHVARSYKSL